MATAEDSQWNLLPKYVDECLDIVKLQHAKAVMMPLTEQKSLNLHDETTAFDQAQHSFFQVVVGKNCNTLLEWDQMWCSRQNNYHTNFRHQYFQISHVKRKRTEFLPDDTCIETKRLEQDLETHHGIFRRWMGWWRRRAHLAHCVTLITFLFSNECRRQGLLPCPVENQKCMLLVHC